MSATLSCTFHTCDRKELEEFILSHVSRRVPCNFTTTVKDITRPSQGHNVRTHMRHCVITEWAPDQQESQPFNDLLTLTPIGTGSHFVADVTVCNKTQKKKKKSEHTSVIQ